MSPPPPPPPAGACSKASVNGPCFTAATLCPDPAGTGAKSRRRTLDPGIQESKNQELPE